MACTNCHSKLEFVITEKFLSSGGGQLVSKFPPDYLIRSPKFSWNACLVVGPRQRAYTRARPSTALHTVCHSCSGCVPGTVFRVMNVFDLFERAEDKASLASRRSSLLSFFPSFIRRLINFENAAPRRRTAARPPKSGGTEWLGLRVR